MAKLAKTAAIEKDVSRISRDDAAVLLGVSKSAIRHLERSGELRTVTTDDAGKVWIERAEVLALAARRQKRRPGRMTQGQLEAAAMAHFEAAHATGELDRCVPSIVMATLLPTSEVIRLRTIYASERGVVLKPAPAAPVPIDHAREARALEERIAAEREAFERDMSRRRRELDRELGAEDDDEEIPAARGGRSKR